MQTQCAQKVCSLFFILLFINLHISFSTHIFWKLPLLSQLLYHMDGQNLYAYFQTMFTLYSTTQSRNSDQNPMANFANFVLRFRTLIEPNIKTFRLAEPYIETRIVRLSIWFHAIHTCYSGKNWPTDKKGRFAWVWKSEIKWKLSLSRERFIEWTVQTRTTKSEWAWLTVCIATVVSRRVQFFFVNGMLVSFHGRMAFAYSASDLITVNWEWVCEWPRTFYFI